MHSEITKIDNSSAIQQQLERILLSETFRNSARLKAFLKLTVNRTLEGRSSEIKQFLIATEVFQRPAERFDPQIDPIVRVEAGRLRAKLREYYELEGGADPVLIRYPKGGYVPVFESRRSSDDSPRPDAPPPTPLSPIDESNGRPAFPKRFAVLPFRDLSSKEASTYLGEGIAAQIINRLARLPSLQVVSQTSSFLYRGDAKDIRIIGRELGVDGVIDGSVRAIGQRLSVTSQINDATSGYLLWSSVFERLAKDVLAIQEEVARTVTQVIETRLPSADCSDWDAVGQAS